MGSKSPPPQKTTGTQTTQQLSSPSIEAALSLYTPQLMGMLSGTIDTSTFAPKVAPQTALQGQAIKSALAGQGFDYDIDTGAVTGTGIGAYQPHNSSRNSCRTNSRCWSRRSWSSTSCFEPTTSAGTRFKC